MNRPIKAVLFDKDGTLLDFHATWDAPNRRAAEAAAHGDAALAARLLEAAGHDEASGRVRAGTILAQGTARELAAFWLAHTQRWSEDALTAAVEAALAGARPAPAADMFETLAALRAHGMTLGVLTNDAEAPAKAQLRALDADGYFAFVAGYDSGFGVKPAPGGVTAFCAHAGVTAPMTAFVGDSPHDMETGRRAGCGLVIGVLNGPAKRVDLAPAADIVLENLAELPEALGLI